MKLLSLLLSFMFHHFTTKGDIIYYFISNGCGAIFLLSFGWGKMLYTHKQGFSDRPRMWPWFPDVYSSFLCTRSAWPVKPINVTQICWWLTDLKKFLSSFGESHKNICYKDFEYSNAFYEVYPQFSTIGSGLNMQKGFPVKVNHTCRTLEHSRMMHYENVKP